MINIDSINNIDTFGHILNTFDKGVEKSLLIWYCGKGRI